MPRAYTQMRVCLTAPRLLMGAAGVRAAGHHPHAGDGVGDQAGGSLLDRDQHVSLCAPCAHHVHRALTLLTIPSMVCTLRSFASKDIVPEHTSQTVCHAVLH